MAPESIGKQIYSKKSDPDENLMSGLTRKQ